MRVNIKEHKSKKHKKIEKSHFNFSKHSLLKFKIGDKIKSKFYRELKVLIQSGVTIEEALTILKYQVKKDRLKDVIGLLYLELLKGKSLVDSMLKTKSFSSFEINTVSIGEETKNLPKVLGELEIFFDRKYKLKNQILTVLTYPVFVIIITIAVLVFMLRNVVPMFEKVFKQFNSDLPSLTKKIIYISNNFSYIIMFFTGITFVLIFIYLKYRKTNSYRGITSKIVLRIPFFGRMVKAIYMSRFCRALSLLLSSKVSLVDSLSFVKDMIGFYPIESSIDEIKNNIIKGNSLSNSLSKHKIYDASLISMLRVSEEVNELDVMFDYLTDQYTNEVDTKSKRIGALIEPFIIIIIGSLVGVIMISMYLPMFDLSKILNSN